jgi:hypothetical protein
LVRGTTVRYEVRIEVKAAYDPLDATDEDSRQDFRKFDKEFGDLEGFSTEDAETQVHRLFDFDLCPTCQRDYVADPLGKKNLA